MHPRSHGDLYQGKAKWIRNIDSLGELLCQGNSDWIHLKQDEHETINKRNFKNFLYKPIHNLQTNTCDNLTYLLEQS